jgi:hypothetical protein
MQDASKNLLLLFLKFFLFEVWADATKLAISNLYPCNDSWLDEPYKKHSFKTELK